MDALYKKYRRLLWNGCRCSLRCCRIAALTLVLIVLAALTWLSLAGLPEFLRVRVVAELSRRGVVADFSDLRFHWFRGLVASDLRIAWGGTNGPSLSISEADIDIAPPPWRASRDIVRGLRVRSGSLALPLPVDNEPTRDLRVEKIVADIRFLPGDAWDVQRLSAQVLGLDLELRAAITNISGLRSTRPTPNPAAANQQRRLLRDALDDLQRWSFTGQPRVQASLQLDGARPEYATGNAYVDIPEVRTPHGDMRRLRISIRSMSDPASATNALTSAISIELADLQTRDGGINDVSGRLELRGLPRPSLPTLAEWQLNADHLSLHGLRARKISLHGSSELLAQPTGMSRADLENLPLNTRLTANADQLEITSNPRNPFNTTGIALTLNLRHPLVPHLNIRNTPGNPSTTDPVSPPLSGTLALNIATVSGQPGTSGPVRIQGSFSSSTQSTTPPPDIAAWSTFWPFTASLDASIQAVQSPGLNVDQVDLGVDWNPPLATIRNLSAALFRGKLNAHGDLDVVRRLARLHATSTFDVHGIDALLGPKSRENFVRYQWVRPPWFEGDASVVLPAWSDPKPDWNGAVKASLRVDGRFKVGHGGFKGVPFDSAESSISFDGNNVRLPDLHTTRPEGSQQIIVDYSDKTHEYRVDARGIVDPPVLRPLLGDKSAEVLDLFQFKAPVDAHVSVWGPWTEGNKQSIVGTARVPGLVFRGHRFDLLEASVTYTNQRIAAGPVRLTRGAGELSVDQVSYDLATDLLSIGHATNTIDPLVVTAAINPEFPEKLKYYQFDSFPRVRVEGTIHPRQAGTALLNFDVEGGPFHFWRFSADKIATRLMWHGQNLTLTNIAASFYRGSFTGNAQFDLAESAEGKYRFLAEIRDSHLDDLLKEVTDGHTNVAQGSFDLNLDIDSARTSDIRTWNGTGIAALRDGLIWDTPLFGFMSPVLNALIPGLGNNRAKRADATFVVSNGVFHTKDLSIACPPAKLLYRGSVDLDQRINAKVEAQVLGDILGFGPIFGLVLKPLTKLFEYRVTGTLTKFDAEPLYALPKVILLPLQPLRVIKGIFTPAPAPAPTPRPEPATNAPPDSPPPLSEGRTPVSPTQ